MEPREAEKFRTLEEAIVHAEGNLESAKEEVKAAKTAYDEALFELRMYARELTNPPRFPLLDGDTVNQETGEITNEA